MGIIIFTAAGCTRCKIVKDLIDDLGLTYEEKDINGDGKQDFRHFYTANRSAIYRGKAGVEFPVLLDRDQIRQGLGRAVAYLKSGSKLDGFFGHGELTKEWLDGVHISGGDAVHGDDFIGVLQYLAKKGMKLQLNTWGKNGAILESALASGFGHRVIMQLLGPPELYEQLAPEVWASGDVEKSIKLVTQFPQYEFQIPITPVIRAAGDPPVAEYITPHEVGQTAKWIKELTGNIKNPCSLKLITPDDLADEEMTSLDALSANALFKYRTAARRHQVFTEIEKQ